MDWKLEVVTIPVADIDRAKRFYADHLAFAVDLDESFPNGGRLVQLTPPGSGCSIHLNSSIETMTPGSLDGLVIVVDDVEAARSELVSRDVVASPVQHLADGTWVEGRGGDWNSFVMFADPDGNRWTLQERPHRPA